MDALNTALDLIKRGFYVFPLVNNKKIPATENGCKDASTDEQIIRNWFGNVMFLGRNIGIKCENILVVDVDVKNKNGLFDLAKIEREIGYLPKSCVVKTQSGGFHYYFKRPKGDFIGQAGIKFNGKATSIDIRVGNQYVVAPKSIVDGKEYLWEGSIPESVDSLPELPDSWKEFLPKKEAPKHCAAPVSTTYFESNEKIRRCRAFMKDREIAVQGQHGQNTMYNTICAIFCGFDLTEAEGRDILMEYNSRCLPPWDMSNPQDAKYIERSINEAIKNATDRGKLLREYSKAPSPEVHCEFIEFEEQTNQDSEAIAVVAHNPFSVGKKTENISERIGILRQSEAERKEMERITKRFEKTFGSLKEVEEDVSGTIPYEILSIPGFVNHCTEIIASRTPLYNHHCAFVSALSLLSAIVGEKFTFHGCYANLYLIALADSGSGKDAVKQFISGAYAYSLNNRGMGNCFGMNIKSGEGLEDSMLKCPRQHFLIDEIAYLFNEMGKEGSCGESMQGYLNKFYTATGGQTKVRSNIKTAKLDAKDNTIWNAYLTFVGTSTPKEYYRSFSEKMIAAGLYGRLLILKARRGIRQKGEEFTSVFEECDYTRIDNFAKFAQAFYPLGNKGSEVLMNDIKRPGIFIPAKLRATKGAWNILGNFEDIMDCKLTQRDVSENEKPLYSRASEKIYKLSMLYEISRKWNELTATIDEHGKVDARKVNEILCVDEECVNWAYGFLIYVMTLQCEDLEKYRFVNEHDKDLKEIKEIIRDVCDRSTMKICQRRSVYKRKTGLTSSQVDEIINDLIAQGAVKIVEKKDNGGVHKYTGLVIDDERIEK